ncbi:hypothetical protein S40293_10025 [Stachybotrys chartarum IBT 40293]|nr:hypothetical protein S40293_10025 [Stachybotrys chartarum IBT 40293]
MKFRTSTVLPTMALVRLAMAAEVSLIWGIALDKGEEVITASHDGVVMATACSNELTIDGVPIIVMSDTSVMGNLTVGDKVYKLEDEDICVGLWNDMFAEVICKFPWDGDLDITRQAVPFEISKCFAGEEAQNLFPFIGGDGHPLDDDPDSEEGNLIDVTEDILVENMRLDPALPAKTGLDRRQIGCIITHIPDRPAHEHKLRRHLHLTAS